MSESDYLNLLRDIKDIGSFRGDRTGVGTKGVFGRQLRYNLKDELPLFTTKQVHYKSVIHELLWFVSGRTDNQWLQERGVRIWNEWATKEACAKFNRPEGDLGPIYGHQWRNFGGDYSAASRAYPNRALEDPIVAAIELDPKVTTGFDQIDWVIREIKSNPNSRRLIVSGWNPFDACKVSLPPCHTLFQFYVDGDKLSCQLYQRSVDLFLGAPFNVASYAILTYMVAHVCGLKPHEFIHTLGDAHIYTNHFEQVETQLTRVPNAPPKLRLNAAKTNIFDFKFEDFAILDYNHHPKISAPVAI